MDRPDGMRLLLAARLSKKPRKKKDGTLEKPRDPRDGLGIETQDEQARPWAEREGHTVIETVADYKSGTVAPWDRKNLREWVTDPALMALYDGILAYKMDRLSRGTQEDFTRIEHWAAENGKRLVIVDGPQYPERPGTADRIVWTVYADQARKEWEAIRERNTRAQAKLRAGGHLVGRYPFGYVSDGEEYARHLVPTEVGREYIPQVFARIEAGESLATVALWLKAEGVATLQGNDWSAERIASVIRNPVYRGHRVNGKGITEHRCEALVDAAAWERANVNLNARPGRGIRPANVNGEALLKSVLRCPRCDGPMYRIYTGRAGTSNRVPYYRCKGVGAVQQSECRNMVRVADADALVSGFMSALEDEIMVLKVVPGTNHEAEIAEVNAELAELPRRGLDDDEEDAARAILRAERARLKDLEPTPDVVEMVPTGETYASRWSDLEPEARGAWLRSVGLQVWLVRGEMSARYRGRRILPGMRVEEDGPGRIAVTMSADGLWAVIAWNSAQLGELDITYG